MRGSIDDLAGKRVHFVGAGGSSMSGLCRMVRALGATVTGSDRDRSYATEALEAAGIPVAIGHSAEAVRGADLVVYSAAIPDTAPERVEATRLGIPQIERSELLGMIQASYPRSVAVCGTHGKTTATSMIASILIHTDMDPSIHIGGVFDPIGGSVRTGQGDVFLTEACEYHDTFLHLHPTVALVLNIDADHLDWFRDIEHIEQTFAAFLQGMPEGGVVVGCGDDPRVRRLLDACPSWGLTPISYGRLAGDVHARDIERDATGRPAFTIVERGEALCRVQLGVSGDQNLDNALGATAAARVLGVGVDAVVAGLGSFVNAHRRFEHTGDVQGVALYHDYAHNPTEVRSVIPMALAQPHRKLWVVHQPHTYSRTKQLFEEFATAFAGADEVLVTDIYGAREADPGDIHATDVVRSILATGTACTYTPSFEDAKRYLAEHWQAGDLVVTVGCGNVNLLNDLIQEG